MSLTLEEYPDVLSLAGNRIWFVYSTNETSQSFIGIFYKVQIEIDSSWVDQCNLIRYEPDSDGNAPIDIHSILDWDPAKEFTWPEVSPFFINSHAALVRTYRIQAYEKYGNPLTQHDVDIYPASGGRLLLPGKLPELQMAKLNDANDTWFDLIQANKQFLTNSPRIKRTDGSTPERLYHYVLSTGTTSLKLKVKCYYSDGSNATVTKQTLTSITGHIVYEIITSFTTLDLPLGGEPTDPTLPILKYDVWLTDQSDVTLSEVFTFLIDYRPYDEAKYFLFANAFKMIEGARFVNHLKTYTKPTQAEIARSLPKGFGIQDPTMIKDDVSEIVYREVSSDWLSPDEIRWLREITLSKEVYEVIGGKTVPVRVEAASLVSHEKDKNLRQIKMTYSYAHSDSVPADYSDF